MADKMTSAERKTKTKNLGAVRCWSRRVAKHYRLPIYLVGSALMDANYRPRDWDLRMRMPVAEFERRFGDVTKWTLGLNSGDWTEVNYRWSDECTKRTKDAWKETRVNVDFQIYPPSTWRRYRGQPRRRLA